MANTSTEIRNIQFAANDPGAVLDVGRKQSQGVGQQVPDDAYGRFNTMLMGLLKDYQSLGTRPFVEQELGAREAAANRVFQTPGELIGAAPGVQASVRDASVSALTPTVQGARESRQTYSEQLKSFGDSVNNIRSLLKEQEETTNKRRDDARAVIKDALTLGGADALNDLSPDEITKLEKTAGYPKGYIQGLRQTIKDRELALRGTNDKPVEVSPGGSLVDPNTGEVIYSAPEKDAVQKDAAAAALKSDALKSAQELATKLKDKKGTSAVGKSGLFKSFGYGFIPGTDRANFEVQFKNLKSLLSLDNVKYLKGQGQVSDAERDLLASAAAKLELSQSEPEFRKALDDIVKALSGGTDDPLDLFSKANGTTSSAVSASRTSGGIKLGSPLARANNNPGNLRFVGQAGAAPGKGGFARFASPQAGYAALVNQIKLDASRGHTIASFISKYAPPTENDTNLYVRQISQWLGVSPNTKVKDVNVEQLAKAMAKKESSTIIA